MCVDCLDNCEDPISDGCVKIKEDIPCLGICKGDTLYQFEVIIAEKLCAALDGTGIDLSSVNLNCSFLTTLLGSQDKNLKNLIQILADGECTLRELIANLDALINTPYSFNTSCLSGLSATPTKDDILNAALIKLCSVNSRVTAIENDYVKDSQLCAKVATCISAGSGDIQENSKMPKYVALPYHGPLTVFDSGGVGLSSFGYSKVYICNGQTVGSFITPDYRGRSPIGANLGIPGGGLDSFVNPSLPQNASYGITAGLKKGEYTNTLTLSSIPAHTHPVNDPGHQHDFPGQKFTSHPSGGSSQEYRDAAVQKTELAYTDITIGSAGSSQAHNNTHPSIGTIFIMYIP